MLDRLVDALSVGVLVGIGFWLGRIWNDHRVQTAEDKAEDILSERNYWKDIAQKEIAENIKLGREITAALRPATVVERAIRDHQANAASEDEEEQPMSVREADALEMQRRRAAERIRRTPRPEDEITSDREPVHVDDQRATPPIRTTDLARDD